MNSSSLGTLHAPAERVSQEKLIKQSNCFTENASIVKVLNAVSIYILVINQLRQIIFANEAFANALGLESYQQLLGKRPGEAVACIHSAEHNNGCGTSEACRTCNAVNIVLSSMQNGRQASGEVSISYKNGSLEFPMNMFESVTPIELCNEKFYFISMLDISDSLRKRVLERLFFHDILNTSGALKGLVEMLKDDVPANVKPEVEFLEDALSWMVEEIIEQKQLNDAESSDLSVESITLNSNEIIELLVNLYSKHEVASYKSIEANVEIENIVFRSDFVLLKRILGNMLKNALEASEPLEKVKIGCRRIITEKEYIEFWVWNKRFIPRDVQHQIFQRSFSTKGRSRGNGTYSIKLLGEKYLNGKVGFESSEEEGTRFYIRLLIE